MMRLVAFVFVFLVGCGPVPGGKLDGKVQPVPSSWAQVIKDTTICEIESRPADPHSIQLECFLHEGGLFVQSHRWVNASWWPGISWALIWQKYPDVKVRIAGALYELRSRKITDQSLRTAILTRRGYKPIPDGIVVFQFEPRD